MTEPLLGQPSAAPQPRCPACKSFLQRLACGDTICNNARCGQSWQAFRASFESSLLGAACRQLIGGRNA